MQSLVLIDRNFFDMYASLCGLKVHVIGRPNENCLVWRLRFVIPAVALVQHLPESNDYSMQMHIYHRLSQKFEVKVLHIVYCIGKPV